MVSFGVSSMFFHEYTISEIFSFVSRAGLDGMEFWLETPDFWLRNLPVPEVIASRNLHPCITSLNVHTPILDLNPCSINPEVAAVSVSSAVRSVSVAESLGARTLTVHPGRRTAKRPPGEADEDRFRTYISALHRATVGNHIRIAMENMEVKVNSLLCTPDRMREVLDHEPWLFFTLDTAHALAQSEKEALRYIDLCSDRLVNVHISRVDGHRLHLPLDQDPGIARILASLKDHHFSGSLVLEIDDLNFSRTLSADEKIAILRRDSAFMHECLN
ncbi:MAG: sugar phosphate isomerase/epimerase [Methanoregula sp.]